jgi:hypothetical protein
VAYFAIEVARDLYGRRQAKLVEAAEQADVEHWARERGLLLTNIRETADPQAAQERLARAFARLGLSESQARLAAGGDVPAVRAVRVPPRPAPASSVRGRESRVVQIREEVTPWRRS